MALRILRWVGAAAAIGWVVAAVGLAVLYFASPDPSPLADHDPETTSWIERARASGQTIVWIPVPIEHISEDLRLAVIVAEDMRFFEHRGFDRYEIRAALRDALAGRRLRGASTITQQLARNLWLSNERTPERKIKEAVLAWKLEHTLTKRRILELYLNTAIFGHGAIGAEAASLRYFGVPASDLTREQAARLAATLPAPSKWYPGSDSPRAAHHYARILERMELAGNLRDRL